MSTPPSSLSLADSGAALLARFVERSGAARSALRRLSFPGRGRIVSRLRADALPADELVTEDDGIRYRVSLRDDVQRDIYFGVYEREDIADIAALVKPGDVCLDVGANVGYYALHFARWVGDGGRVHAFEPDARVRARLEQNCALNAFGTAVRVHAVAVSDHIGEAEFFSSAENHGGWGSLVEFGDIARGRTTVPLTTLDAFLDREGIAEVALMKVDVEANEFELLAGAQGALARRAFRAVLIEFNGIRLAQRGRTLGEFLEAFAAHGYAPARLNLPVLDDVRAGRIRPESLCLNFLFERT